MEAPAPWVSKTSAIQGGGSEPLIFNLVRRIGKQWVAKFSVDATNFYNFEQRA
jgi:hypothetical protein